MTVEVGAYNFSLLGQAYDEWLYRQRLEEAVTHALRQHGVELTYVARYYDVKPVDLEAAVELVWFSWVANRTIPLERSCRFLLPDARPFAYHPCPSRRRPITFAIEEVPFSLVQQPTEPIMMNLVTVFLPGRAIMTFRHGVCLKCGLVAYSNPEERKLV